MLPNDFGTKIKKIRQDNNLTQQQLADKYNVTYQAVSKWENGINMPDITLIKQISKDFNVSIDELLGEKDNKKKFSYLFLIPLVIVLAVVAIINPFKKDNDFKFKTLSTTCSNFNISGNISYNENKLAIYINNIEYCGGDDTEIYKTIECTLYESHNNIERQVSTYKSTKENIKLEDFLKEVILTTDGYQKTCKEYEEENLYLLIKASLDNEKIVSYKIPLKLNSCVK